MPFVIVQAINPKLLKAPQDVYKPGSVHDIPLLLKNSGAQRVRLTGSARTTNILINSMNTGLFITAEKHNGFCPSMKRVTYCKTGSVKGHREVLLEKYMYKYDVFVQHSKSYSKRIFISSLCAEKVLSSLI